ncbi:MAG TPA: glycosyltransferase [Candidatus Angelobacter sp.]|nr:glycosyltransferase [Candidatus Angelobacter sp.]
MSDNVIQSLWIGPRLSSMEKLCIESFLHHGHEFHLYLYSSVDGVPARTTLCDANKIVPSSRIFYYSENGSCAGFANMFRYKLLLERGGWWVDTDTVCLRPFDFSESYIFSSESVVTETESLASHHVNNGIIRTPPGTEFMRNNWEYCRQSDSSSLKWGDTGPKLMARAIDQYSLGQYVQPPYVFCPIPFNEWNRVLVPGIEWRFGAETKAVHLWNEMWRRNNCSKDAGYDPDCLYERFKSLYLNGANNGAG